MTPEEFKNLKIGDIIYWTHRPTCVARIDRLDDHVRFYYLSGDMTGWEDWWNTKEPTPIKEALEDDQFKHLQKLTNEKKLELL